MTRTTVNTEPDSHFAAAAGVIVISQSQKISNPEQSNSNNQISIAPYASYRGAGK